MPKCTHQGCGQDFDESSNPDGGCSYHPGGPVFHEGLKSWSCCQETNKPVLEFEAFMALPPCATGQHSSTPLKPAAAPSSSTPAPTSSSGGIETYGSALAPAQPAQPTSSAPAPAPAFTPSATGSGTATPAVVAAAVEEDDLAVAVPPEAVCKRPGCGAKWEGEEVSRGTGEKAVCKFHSQPAIFHEGSKGYLCCKRRVLEFSEFLNIAGCTEGTHLFVGAKRDETKEEVVNCRVDHYQTPLQVHVSAFAKGADKERSSVTFTSDSVNLSLFLPGNRRVLRTLSPYGPIVPESSSYRILSTKVEIVLVKPSVASWPLLELPAPGTELPPGYALTFGVHGRTGTVGGKEIVLAPEELAKRG